MKLGSWHWYDLVILGLTAMIVYPDQILHWIGQLRRRSFVRWHAVILGVVAIFLTIGSMVILMPVCSHLSWWAPLLYTGALVVVRLLYWLGEKVVRGFFDV